MKFNRKGKTVFAIALTACMAGMAFSALPLLSVHAVEEKLQQCNNGNCDQNGYNAQGPCTTFTYTADSSTNWDELKEAAEKVKCTGWVFDGWYTKELEYKYWGDKDEVFACYDTGILFPKQDWKCALEFAEAYSDSAVVSESETSQKTNYFKDLFGRWLTRFKSENEASLQKEQDDKAIIEATKRKIGEYKVTEENVTQKVQVGESVTLYARMKPQVVQIKFLSKKPEEQKAKEDPNRPGLHYADVSQYIRIYRQYGTPLGEIFKHIGDVQFGRTLTGWRKEGETDKLDKEDGTWTATTSAYVNYWWCPKALKEGFVESTPGKSDYKTKYDWSLNLYAVYENENDVKTQAEQEQEAREKALQDSQQKDTPKPEPDDTTEKEHICGNGTLSFKEATCREKGIKPHFHCSCGKGYWDQNCTQPVNDKEELIAQTHHNLIKIQGKKATCTEAGTADRWVCTTCHETFADAKGENKLDNDTIEALGHKYGNETNGKKVCERCGNVDESGKNTVEPEVKLEDQPQVQPQAQEQPTIEEAKKEEAPKPETKKEVKEEEVKKEEVKEETKPEPKQETTAPQTPVAPEQDEEEEKDEVVIEREQQTRPSSRRSARA